MIIIDGRIFNNIKPRLDQQTSEALDDARLMKKAGLDTSITAAIVDRDYGLVLLEGPLDDNPDGWHFRTPKCGYEGTGSETTAEILEVLGFGTKDELYARLKSGDLHTFTR